MAPGPIPISLCIHRPRLSEQFSSVPTSSDNRGCTVRTSNYIGHNGPEFSTRARPEARPGSKYSTQVPDPARRTQEYSLCLPELYWKYTGKYDSKYNLRIRKK